MKPTPCIIILLAAAVLCGASEPYPQTITSPPGVITRSRQSTPPEPYIIRYDTRATRFEEPPGPGLREDLRMDGETWPDVKFGPMRATADGSHYIFICAGNRSRWVPASALPECIRLRFGIPGKK